jgi:hypothetical protein
MTTLPTTWAEESLTELLERLGYSTELGTNGRTIARADVGAKFFPRSNGYELVVLWLVGTRQIVLDAYVEKTIEKYREFGLGPEVDEALAAARETT